MDYITKNSDETSSLGQTIAKRLQGGDIILLHGDLGAGKTTITKGIAAYFGIEEVVSPTFTLMQEYKINRPQSTINRLVHIDTYRLEDEDQLLEIGAQDYLGAPGTICIIEWPKKIKNILQNKKVLNITIEHKTNEERLVVLDF